MKNNSSEPWFSERGRPITWQGKFAIYAVVISFPIYTILLFYTHYYKLWFEFIIVASGNFISLVFVIIILFKKDKSVK
jgi:polyferredoxin